MSFLIPENDGPRGAISTRALQRKGFEWWDVSAEQAPNTYVSADDRCGIYVLAFEDSQWYVGQSVDFLRRYGDHRRNHGDIARLYSKNVPPAALDRTEARLVAKLESSWGWPIRNIRLSSLPKGDSDLLGIVSERELEEWVKHPEVYLGSGARKHLDVQIRKLAARRAALERHPRAEEARMISREYLRAAIPLPLATEMEHWSMTCLPQNQKQVLLRVNLNWQEVFTLSSHPEGLRASFHVARSALRLPILQRIKFRFRHLGMALVNHKYRPGGADQVALALYDADWIMRLLQDTVFIRAARLFNSRLMLKGRVNASNAASHCAGWVAALEL